jgi:xylulokinase
MSLIGLDIGTTGCKAIVFDYRGHILGQGAREYAIDFPHPGWAEQDAEQVWQMAWEALAEAVSQTRQESPRQEPPRALALSVQGEAIIPVDAQGRALRPAILGMDTRTAQENDWLAGRFGAEALFARTGMPLHTINTLPKLLWLQRHEPDLWRTASGFLLYEDFFLKRLGGSAAISHCLASRTQMYDLLGGGWAEEVLDACAIDPRRLAPLAPAEGGAVGAMRRDLVASLGLPGEVLLVSGGHDQACAALGSGVLSGGKAMDSTGTAEVVEVAMASPALGDAVREGGISVYRHVVPGLYLAMTLNHSGGLLLRWFRDTLSRWEVEQARAKAAKGDAYQVILSPRAGVPDGPTDLLVLPHFSGSGTPWLDTASKGAIVGLSFATTHATIAKAILEGLTFELRVNLELLRDAGVEINVLHAVGGGARSPLWLQLKADICGVPLHVPAVTEAACLGAALLAGAGAGVYRDLPEAVAQTVHLTRQVDPNPERAAAYETRYALYRELYPALRALSRQL